MLSNWQRVVQEKLFLAETLIRQAGEVRQADAGAVTSVQGARSGNGAVGLQSALIQGAIALLLQARAGLLLLVAELNQNRAAEVRDLGELERLLGSDNPDLLHLDRLSRDRTGWWQHLTQLEAWLKQPAPTRKPATDPDLATNVIAVSADGPDLSTTGLLELTAAFKSYVSELCSRHDEW